MNKSVKIPMPFRAPLAMAVSDKKTEKKPLAFDSRVRASIRHCDLKWSFCDGLSNAIKLDEKNGHWILQTADLKIVDIGVRL